MVKKQQQQSRYIYSRSEIWSKFTACLRMLLMVISCASLGAASISVALTIAPSTGFANNSAASAPLTLSYMQKSSYSLTQPSNVEQTAQTQNTQPQQSSSAISPAPLSLVALLLIVLAAAIRRHQSQL